MRVHLRFSLAASVLLSSLAYAPVSRAQDSTRAEQAKLTPPASALRANRVEDDKDKKDKDKSATPAPPVADPLLRMLVAKGMISADEARAVSGGTAAETRDRLAALLRDKGFLSNNEFDALHAAQTAPETVTVAYGGQTQNPNQQKPEGAATAPKPPAGPTVVPAIAPIRALQLDGAKRDALFPAIKLASGAKLSPYGFFKTSIVHDSSSQQGNDFPLPGFLGDTGPRKSPEFHIKARSFRLGVNFEWLDPSPKTTVTGKLEFDFEGNFTRANNRNISSIRSSQPSLRIAWVRIDRTFNDKSSAFALFGSDWTPFASSTLPNLIETTGLGLAFGTLYERAPQARFGINYKLGGEHKFSIQPEFAIVLPAFGNLSSDLGTQLGEGERQGVDANRPEVQGRLVLQFQLDKAPGVVPAQLIGSFMQGSRRAIVTAANVPLVPGATGAAANAFRAAFPNGAQVDSDRYGFTLEGQFPTRFVTVIGKFYNGEDLRFYFAGQLLSNYNDTFGLTSTATGASIDGSSNVVFGLQNGVATVAPQRPVRSRGGFINFGFPLSRIFNADPKGRNAGWTAFLHYGYDQATPRDVRRFGAPSRTKGDLVAANLQYKLNSFVTFAYEQSLYRTRSIQNAAGVFPLFRGIPSRETHDVRSEFATIFTF